MKIQATIYKDDNCRKIGKVVFNLVRSPFKDIKGSWGWVKYIVVQ